MPKNAQSHHALVQALLALEDRARVQLGAQGQAYSRAGTVRAVQKHYKIDLQNNLSSWLNKDPSKRHVPGDADAVWALVQVWGRWAGISDVNHRYWRELVEDAQGQARSDSTRTATKSIDKGDVMGHYFNVGANSVVTNESVVSNSRIGSGAPSRDSDDLSRFIADLRKQVEALGVEDVLYAFEVLDSEIQKEHPNPRLVAMSVPKIVTAFPQVERDPAFSAFLNQINSRR